MSEQGTIVRQLRVKAKACVDCKHCNMTFRPHYKCFHPKTVYIDKVTGKPTSLDCEDQREVDSEPPDYCGQQGYYFERKESMQL